MTDTLLKIGRLEITRNTDNNTIGFLLKDNNNKDKKPDLKTVGVSGNTGRDGIADTGEYLANLDGYTGRTTYDEMGRSDPQIRAVLQAIILPLRQANYYIDPASDSPQDIEIAEQAELDFFKNMSITWDDVIRHICLMFPFGFSVMEKIWEIRDNRVVPKKLDPRLPQSIIEWVFDAEKDRLTGPKQVDTNGDEIVLPIEKIVVFSIDKEGDNWEGMSILRPAYKPWYIKDKLEKINAIKHDRHGVGIPVMHTPANMTDAQKDGTQEVLENIQANEQSYVSEPEGFEFRIEGAGGVAGGTDTLPSIKYYDEKISMAMLAMFINLGTTETGSRALGGEFTDVFRNSVQAYANYICETLTRFAIKEYVDYNWNVEEYPTLKVRRILRIDPEVIASLTKAGVITSDLDVENAVREDLNLPEKLEEEEPEEEEETEEPDPDEPDEEDEEIENSYNFADQTTEEALCDFAAIEIKLDQAQDTLESAVLAIREKQIEGIISQLIGGRKPQKIVVSGKQDMYNLLTREMKRQIKSGKSEVQEEIKNQLPSTTLANIPEDKAFLEIMVEELALKVEGASDKLKSTIAGVYYDMKKAGLKGDELRTAIGARLPDTVSDATWKELTASAVNGGWGYGRRTGAEGYEDKIDYAYYSSVLDSNTCTPCSEAASRGTRHEIDDAEFVTPNPRCKGGSRCRCLTIYVMKEESV